MWIDLIVAQSLAQLIPEFQSLMRNGWETTSYRLQTIMSQVFEQN